ncbi:MAG: hypothetical protein LPK13_14015 [Marinobacter sp.]|nr:hypothetical protein [Marinobacter sp.]
MKYRAVLFICAALMLAGCKEEESSSGTGGMSNTKFEMFDVIGTNGKTGKMARLDPYENGGVFTIKWRVRSSTSYWIYAAVSADDTPSKDDRTFVSESCGFANDVCSKASAELACMIGTNNVIACESDKPANHYFGPDLTSFFNTLPKQGWIVVEACRSPGFDCFRQAHKVEFH